MTSPPYTPGPWFLHYHQAEDCFVVGSPERPRILELPAEEDEEVRANLHLLASAPQLYEALRELLQSQEEALLRDNLGCECERCDHARYLAYQALGQAEGRVALQEGDPGTA